MTEPGDLCLVHETSLPVCAVNTIIDYKSRSNLPAAGGGGSLDILRFAHNRRLTCRRPSPAADFLFLWIKIEYIQQATSAGWPKTRDVDMKVIDATQPTRVAASARSLTSTVFHLLRSSIVYGQLEPGTKLSAGHLAVQYRVGLSAIREALARLAAEGLLESQDHRGFRVARISKEELLDLTQTRIDIESIALRRSIELGNAAWEERVTTAFEALAAAEGKSRPLDQRRYQLHSDFHHALVEACDSEWLLRIRGILFERAERYRLLSVAYAKVREEVNVEHKQLYQAVIGRNADKATAILSRHTMVTTQALLKVEEGRPNSIFRTSTAKPKRGARPHALFSPAGLIRSA